MSEKEMFLANWEREFQTTLKVIASYPADRLEYQPHEKSSSAKKLMWTFFTEEFVIDMALKGEINFAGPSPAIPATKEELIAAYEKNHKEMVGKVKNLSETDYNSMIKFDVAKGKKADLRKADVLWLVLNDHIHHRGQLSVYIRLAGGKVPSIYGPSADEPWM